MEGNSHKKHKKLKIPRCHPSTPSSLPILQFNYDHYHDFELRKGSGLDFQHGDMSKFKALTPS